METKKPSIFNTFINATEAVLTAQIAKAQNIISQSNEASFDFGKAITKDRHLSIGSQGFYDKTGVMTFEYQKLTSRKSSIISAIMVTLQNKVASYSGPATAGNDKGFRIVLKNEAEEIEKLKEEMFGGKSQEEEQTQEAKSSEQTSDIKKADPR
ncbi:MAG: hypothetical protein DRP09_14090, partial [Candidatus Thorarchaeota archaeon]